jgi:hypothetical protein
VIFDAALRRSAKSSSTPRIVQLEADLAAARASLAEADAVIARELSQDDWPRHPQQTRIIAEAIQRHSDRVHERPTPETKP